MVSSVLKTKGHIALMNILALAKRIVMASKAVVLTELRNEVSTSIKLIKFDILTCSKLMHSVTYWVPTTLKTLATEKNILLIFWFNRVDIDWSDMSTGLNNLKSTIILLGTSCVVDTSDINNEMLNLKIYLCVTTS